MGASAGPDIVENGLVLALDAADFNSFKGEATTNEIVSVTWSGDGGNQASFTKGSVLITDGNLKYKGYETYLWSPGTSNNCYLNGADLSTGRTSTVWTFSCYVKREDGAPITSLNVYMYYPSSDGSAAGTIEDVGNGWYRVSRTRTGTVNYLSLIGFTGFTTGYKYYLSGAQLEKKSYPTTVVATNTTRGTTVATGGGWEDLIGNGNHGELVNGVRESSDNGGSLSFDGSDDDITITSYQLSTSDSSAPYTLSAWINRTGTTTAGGIITQYGSGSSGSSAADRFGFREQNSKLSWWKGGSDLAISTNNIPTNVWKYIVGVKRSDNSVSIYIDGIEVGTGTDNLDFENATLKIGRFGTIAPFSGKISQVQIYNRALTAAEIQQNFNMLRGRFGI